MKLTLPLPPNMANGRMHWRTRQRKRRAYNETCDMACIMYPDVHYARPRVPLAKAKIRATVYVWAKMDADNLMARLKWPVDFLVNDGWLYDDGPDHLEWEMPRQVVDRKNPRVEIELEAA